MAGKFVTDDGFTRYTLQELKSQIENRLKDSFGNDIDLDERGAFGQLVAFFSKSIDEVWQAAQEIYTSRDPDQATGVSLDAISSLTGTSRQDATPTQVNNVFLIGTEGTTIPAGTRAAQEIPPIQDLVYSLDNDVTITASAARRARLALATPTIGTTYSLTIDSVPYAFTASQGETKEEIIAELITIIQAGDFAGTVEADEDFLLIQDTQTDFSFSVVDNLSIDEVGSGGSFTASIDGTYTLPAESLIIIVDSISGWDRVLNPLPGNTGTEVEADTALRLRRQQRFRSTNGTDDAIAGNIFNRVAGVTAVTVVSNRSGSEDAQGRPPHTFEATVIGGDNEEIGQVIWNSQPSGIRSFGNVMNVPVEDAKGKTHFVSFSRPSSILIFVRIYRELFAEEEYPQNGDQAIKEAIVQWALEELSVGTDVIRQRLAIPIYTVPGIGTIQIALDASDDPTHVPLYRLDNITVQGSQIANILIENIVVGAFPPP